MSITPMQMARLAAKYDLRSDRGRIEYCMETSRLIATLQSTVEREIYIDRAAKTANITHEAMWRVVDDARKQMRKEATPNERI